MEGVGRVANGKETAISEGNTEIEWSPKSRAPQLVCLGTPWLTRVLPEPVRKSDCKRIPYVGGEDRNAPSS